MRLKSGIEVTIGADPEFFLQQKGLNVSAHQFVHEFGGKHNPTKVYHGAIQVDGTALEFNIDPAKTAEEFVANVQSVIRQLRARVPTDYTFKFHPTHIFDTQYFYQLPEEAKELGCDPDYDAYTLQPNPKPDVDRNLRTASGHIHIGWTDSIDVESQAEMQQVATFIKQLDAILYPASLIWDKHGSMRREMYGKPGAFRMKKYGCEYRVLSNSWLGRDEIQKWIFNTTVKAFELLTEGVVLPEKDWREACGDGMEGAKPSVYRYITDITNKYNLQHLPTEAYYG